MFMPAAKGSARTPLGPKSLVISYSFTAYAGSCLLLKSARFHCSQTFRIFVWLEFCVLLSFKSPAYNYYTRVWRSPVLRFRVCYFQFILICSSDYWSNITAASTGWSAGTDKKYELIARTKKHHWNLWEVAKFQWYIGTFCQMPVKLIKRNIDVLVGLTTKFAQI